jgi:HAE1 family hydrophobic/amphiphilic exporter-1
MRCTDLLLVLTFAAAAVASPAYAQGRRHGAAWAAAPAGVAEPTGERITLEELLEAAVQRSPGLTIARADRDEARDRDSAADAVDELHLVGRLNGQQTTLDRTLAGPAVALDTRSANADLGIGRGLSTGADITVTASIGQVRYVYPGVVARAQAVNDVIVAGTTASARLEASQPLLRGAGADVARADQTTARLASRALSAQARDEAAGLVRDLVIGYWELTYATEALAVDREGEALAVRQVAMAQVIVRVGLQPPSAVKIAELQLALRKEAILRDEMAIGDQSLAVRRLAGLGLASTTLVPSQAPEVPRTEWSEDAAVAATLVHGPALAQKKLVQRQADVAVDVANNAMLPRLDLKLTGEIDGIGSSAGAAFGQLGTAQAYSIMGGLSLQWDIGGAARAADAGARVHRARLGAERADLEHQLAASAMSAVRQLRFARQRIELTDIAIQVADEALRAEVVAFQAGHSTTVLVFQRQDDVAQAKLRLARARIDAVEAGALLDYLTGGLLARYGVKLADARGVS